MSLKQSLNLLFRGKSIVRNYNLSLTEASFHHFFNSTISEEKSFNFLSQPSKNFWGNSHGEYRRCFEIQSNSSIFKQTTNNLIQIRGEIDPINSEKLKLTVRFERTKYLRFSIFAVTFLLSFSLFSILIQSLLDFNSTILIIFTNLSCFAFSFIILILIGDTNSQIDNFEKNFIEKLKQLENTGS